MTFRRSLLLIVSMLIGGGTLPSLDQLAHGQPSTPKVGKGGGRAILPRKHQQEKGAKHRFAGPLSKNSSKLSAQDAGASKSTDAGKSEDTGTDRSGNADSSLAENTDAKAAGENKAKVPAWAPKLSTTIKPAIVKLGDPVDVTIKVKHTKGVSVNLPLQLELGKFSELSRDEKRREIGAKGEIPQIEQTFILKVAAYDLGELTLPPIEVTALGPKGQLYTLATTPVPIRVKSVMSNEPNAKLKALESPVAVYERNWLLLYILIGIAAVGLVVTATLIIYRHVQKRRVSQMPPPPELPAHVYALEKLGKLDVHAFLQKELFKELYLQLSEIMREYLGRRWHFDALESTTTEIGGKLDTIHMTQEVRQRFLNYLSECDLVKFAKYKPKAEMALQAFEVAKELVRQTAKRPQGVEPGEQSVVTAATPTENSLRDSSGPTASSPINSTGKEPQEVGQKLGVAQNTTGAAQNEEKTHGTP